MYIINNKMNAEEIDLIKLNKKFCAENGLPDLCKLSLTYDRVIRLPEIEVLNGSKTASSDGEILYSSPIHYVYSNLLHGSYRYSVANHKNIIKVSVTKKVKLSYILDVLKTKYSNDNIWSKTYANMVIDFFKKNMIGDGPAERIIKDTPILDENKLKDLEQHPELNYDNEIDKIKLRELEKTQDFDYKNEIDKFNKQMYIYDYFKNKLETKGDSIFSPEIEVVDDFLDPEIVTEKINIGKKTKSTKGGNEDVDAIDAGRRAIFQNPVPLKKNKIQNISIHEMYKIYKNMEKNKCMLKAIEKYMRCFIDQTNSINPMLDELSLKFLVYNTVTSGADKFLGVNIEDMSGYNSLGYILMDILSSKKLKNQYLMNYDSDRIYNVYLASLIFKHIIKNCDDILVYRNVDINVVASRINFYDIQYLPKQTVIEMYRDKSLKNYNLIRLQIHFEDKKEYNSMIKYLYYMYYTRARIMSEESIRNKIIDIFLINKIFDMCGSTDDNFANDYFNSLNLKYGNIKNQIVNMNTQIILSTEDPVFICLKYIEKFKIKLKEKFHDSIIQLYEKNKNNECFYNKKTSTEYILRTPINRIENQEPLLAGTSDTIYFIDLNKNIININLEETYIDFLIKVRGLRGDREIEKEIILSTLENLEQKKNYNKKIRELYNEGLFPPFQMEINRQGDLRHPYETYNHEFVKKMDIKKFKFFLRDGSNDWRTRSINTSKDPLIISHDKEDIYVIDDNNPFSFTYILPDGITLNNFKFNSMYQYVYFKMFKKLPPYARTIQSNVEIFSKLLNPKNMKFFKSLRNMDLHFNSFFEAQTLQAKEILFQKSITKKFEDEELMNILVGTGNKKIIYGSRDKYFGIGSDGKGENIIGDIYEVIRDKVNGCFLEKKGEILPLVNWVLADSRLNKWVSDRINRFATTINIIKNYTNTVSPLEKNYKNILKTIYWFCKFEKNKRLGDQIIQLEEKDQNIFKFLQQKFIGTINSSTDNKQVEYLLTVFKSIFINVLSTLEIFIRNKQITLVDILIEKLNGVVENDFFSGALAPSLYNFLLLNLKKDNNITDVIKDNFKFITNDDFSEEESYIPSFKEIEFDLSSKYLFKKLKSFNPGPSSKFIKAITPIEKQLFKLTHFILQNSDIEEIKSTIGYLPTELYKKYTIGFSLINISNKIKTEINNTIDNKIALELSASILICDDIKNNKWNTYKTTGDELFLYKNYDPTEDGIMGSHRDIKFSDFYFSGQDDMPFISENYKNCNLTALVEFIYNYIYNVDTACKDKNIYFNRIISFLTSSVYN